MNRLFQLLGLRQAEVTTALLMTSYFFLAMTCNSIIKALQNSFYLGKVGFDWRLPLLYVGIALLSGPVVLSYRYLAHKRSYLILGLGTLLFFILSVTAFFFLVRSQLSWVYPLFYVWGGVFTVLLPVQGWMISYNLYAPREAKRLFSVLGTGGILGGAFGGFYTAALASEGGNEWLLLHTCVLLCIGGVLLALVYQKNESKLSRRNRSAQKQETQGGDGIIQTAQNLFDSSYLKHLASLILVLGASTTLIDLIYKWGLENRYEGSELEITQFFGTLLGAMFVFSAPLQLFGTGRLIRRYGVGVGLLVLPIALFMGTIGVAITAAFWSVVVLKLIDGTLRNSLDRTSIELLYLPLSGRVTAPVKSFIDLGVFRLGDAVGATVFLAAILSISSPSRSIGWIILAMTGIWIFVSFRLGKEYLHLLRDSLEEVTPLTAGSRRTLRLDEAVAEKTLIEALESNKPPKVRFAIQQLIQQDSEQPQRIEDLTSGEDLSQSQISVFYETSAPRWLNKIKNMVEHEDPEIAAAAMHLLIQYEPARYLEELRRNLQAKTPPDKRFLSYLDKYSDNPGKYLTPRMIRGWEQGIAIEEAATLARLMGRSRERDFLTLLERWMGHSEKLVAREAITSIGYFADMDYVDKLLQLLEPLSSRRAARKSLSLYGDAIVPRLIKSLKNPHASYKVKREIPLILGKINSPRSREALVAALYLPDSTISFRALKGLNKIRANRELSYTQDSFLPAIQIWVRQYYQLVNTQIYLEGHGGLACRLLGKAINERIDWKVEKIFRALELFLPHGDAYVSYLGYTSDHDRLREHAIELIDSHIRRAELRKTLLPIFTMEVRSEVALEGRKLFDLPEKIHLLLSDMLNDADAWLKCCIIATIAAHDMEDLKPAVQQVKEDVHPLVRETAAWALANWGETKIESYRC